MAHSVAFYLVFLLFLSACGQKSSIKNDVTPRKTADAYGDGKYTILPIILPLSDQEIDSFDSPLSKIGFITGGFAKVFMNLGTSMGMGKKQITLEQPVPELPMDYLKEVRIKRLFFYIEPVKGERRDHNWFSRLFNGRNNVNFNFLDKILVKVSTSHIVGGIQSWLPKVIIQDMDRREFAKVKDQFKRPGPYYDVVDPEKARELVLLKYDENNKHLYVKNQNYGPIYIISTENVKRAAAIRSFLKGHAKLGRYFKRIQVLNESILVELENDPVAVESFKVVLSEEAAELESMGVRIIEPCTPKTCMDLAVADINLVHLITKDNAIKLDAFINAGETPDSFRLKGFIEFQIKLKLSF